MSHRLWFRLDDVLPLAEHAMGCFTHRTTGAQASAFAADGPALIWTGTGVLDLLTSNGTPVWYDERGTIHAARAYAWRDGTGRADSARQDGYDTAYLPLAQDGGTSPVVDLLRGARTSGHSWVTVGIDPADRHLIAAHRVQASACRHDLVPADATWTSAVVTCRDVDDQPYPALIAGGYTSGTGHLLARFDPSTLARIVANLDAVHANSDRRSDPMPGEYPILRLRGDVLTVIEQRDNGRSEDYRVTDHLTPDRDGYYPLGAHLWPWRHATDPTTGR